MKDRIESTIRAMRQTAPLVHNITNFVVMEVTANALLAAGGSPLMAHEQSELDDLLGIASALVLNIGTLDKNWILSMEEAARLAGKHGVPVVLDPVGAGASALRTQTSLNLLKLASPAVLRGNASEIMAVAAALREERQTGPSKGVDSLNTTSEASAAALELARHFHCSVSVSGEEDMITDGKRTAIVSGGSPIMPRVTGLGCSATAITAAHVAVAPDAFTGAAAAMAVMAEAGDVAGRSANGPGSFLPLFLDALYNLDPAAAAARVSEMSA